MSQIALNGLTADARRHTGSIVRKLTDVEYELLDLPLNLADAHARQRTFLEQTEFGRPDLEQLFDQSLVVSQRLLDEQS